MYGTALDIKRECESNGFEHVILCDGGSWASCNTDDLKMNIYHEQYSQVQITNIVPEPVDKPVEVVDKPVDVKPTVNPVDIFKLSDLSNPHTPIIPGLHFYWDEYLQNNLDLKGYEDYDFNVIETAEIMYNIVLHALMMEEFRTKIGRGINAASGYRPDIYNDVVLIKLGYKSTKTSDHKCNNSCALDTDAPVTSTNISVWKNICYKYGVSYSIGLYSWGLHLGYRRNKEPRLWDWR